MILINKMSFCQLSVRSKQFMGLGRHTFDADSVAESTRFPLACIPYSPRLEMRAPCLSIYTMPRSVSVSVSSITAAYAKGRMAYLFA